MQIKSFKNIPVLLVGDFDPSTIELFIGLGCKITNIMKLTKPRMGLGKGGTSVKIHKKVQITFIKQAPDETNKSVWDLMKNLTETGFLVLIWPHGADPVPREFVWLGVHSAQLQLDRIKALSN